MHDWSGGQRCSEENVEKCVKRDMKAMGIKEEMAQDRCAWRNITGGPTRASADAEIPFVLGHGRSG